MKTLKFLFMVWAASSSVAMAQDYYAPTDKEKEAAARFPLPEIRVSSNPDGEKYIIYTLPEELTGEKNTIVASEVNLPGLDSLPNEVRIYSGPKATITCMGSEEKPGCTVTHRNLNLNKAKAYAAVDRAYYDPQMRVDAKLVVDDFQSIEHSGNQPIGFLGGLKLRKDAAVPEFATGTMSTQFDRKGTLTRTDITWKTTSEGVHTASFKVGNDNGFLTDIKYFGNRARGRWSVEGRGSGWFEFNFNAEKTRFDGYYGDNENGSVRVGRWTSLKICNEVGCKKPAN